MFGAAGGARTGAERGARERALVAAAVLALALWAAVAVPLAAGRRTLQLRDVFSNHLALKAFGAAELREGRVPATVPGLGSGLPYRGNPAAVAFYPGNLLYLVLPFWSAFNLHFALHWLLAALAMAALARALGASAAGALVAALLWAGGGYGLSTLSFYNLITVFAWWPLVLWGAARGGARGTAWGGLACGLALLGGEPVTAALGIAPLLLVAVRRHGARRGIGLVAAIVALGAAIAAPQLIATARILGDTLRVGHGLGSAAAADYALHPARLLELVLPLPFGWPSWTGAHGFWAAAVAPRLPYVFTLHVGVVGLWLAARGARHDRAWAGLGLAGLVLAWAGGHLGEAAAALGGGVFRYPEKLLLWFALALALLAARGTDAVLERGGAADSRPGRACLVWAALLLALAGGLALGREALAAAFGRATAVAGTAELVATQAWLWVLGLAVGGALLALAVLAARRGSGGALAATALLALLPLAPLVATDAVAPYREPAPWATALGRGTAVVNAARVVPPWEETGYPVADAPRSRLRRLWAQDLDVAPGALHGLAYPLAPDPEGLATPLHSLLLRQVRDAAWPERVRWLRTIGIDALVTYADLDAVPGLRLLATAEREGIRPRLYGVEAPAPLAWWPRELVLATGPERVMAAVAAAADPLARVAVSSAMAHVPGAAVRVVQAGADALELKVEGGGGLLVVRRAFHPLWRASAGGEPLAILPANGVLLGVRVPAGTQRIRLGISGLPEGAAGLLALAVAVGAAIIGWRRS